MTFAESIGWFVIGLVIGFLADTLRRFIPLIKQQNKIRSGETPSSNLPKI